MTDKIKRAEELVETIANDYATVPGEIVNELNDITGNAWTEDRYLEYCAEYWSRSSLEETVYALFHDGEYPENEESAIYVWKQKQEIELPDLKIMLSLRKACRENEPDFMEQFENLDVALFVQIVKDYFKDWTVSKEQENEASIEIEFTSGRKMEYGRYQYVIFSAYRNKMIEVFSCNMPREERTFLLDRLSKEGVRVFER